MFSLRKESQLPTLGRIVWMGAGPALMAICLVLLFDARRTSWFMMLDVVFAAALLITIGGRWLEHQGADPRTANYEPATSAHLKRYVIVTATAAIALWVIVKLVAVYF